MALDAMSKPSSTKPKCSADHTMLYSVHNSSVLDVWWLMIVLYQRWSVLGYMHTIENHLLHLQLGDQPSRDFCTSCQKVARIETLKPNDGNGAVSNLSSGGKLCDQTIY